MAFKKSWWISIPLNALFFVSVRIHSFILKLLSFSAIVLHGDSFLSPTRSAPYIFMFWVPNTSLSASSKFCFVSAQDSSSYSSLPSKSKLSRLERSSKILGLLLVSSLSFFIFSVSSLNGYLILSVEFSLSSSLSSVIFWQASITSFRSLVSFIVLFNRSLLSLISIVNLSKDVWSDVVFCETMFTSTFYCYLNISLKITLTDSLLTDSISAIITEVK